MYCNCDTIQVGEVLKAAIAEQTSLSNQREDEVNARWMARAESADTVSEDGDFEDDELEQHPDMYVAVVD